MSATTTTNSSFAAEELKTAKKRLRSSSKKTLSSLSASSIDAQSHTAQQTILSLPEYRAATRIGIYLSMPNGEAQTDLLVRDALGRGKNVYVPYIYSPGEGKGKRKVMDMLQLRNVQEYEGLEKDGWGIPKLSEEGVEKRENCIGGRGPSLLREDGEEEVGGLDLIVVPGVAFDRGMNRLGHGAGFYDMFLTRFVDNGREKPLLVGLCLAEQILPPGQLVVQEWDWKVDVVAVGDGRLLTLKDT